MYAAIEAARERRQRAARRPQPDRPRRRHRDGADDGRGRARRRDAGRLGNIITTTPSRPAAGCATRRWRACCARTRRTASASWTHWGVGWARKDGHITATMAPGHDRPRCVYVDFINTGPAVSKTLRTAMARNPAIRKAGDLCIVDLVVSDGEVTGAVAYHLGTGAPVVIAAKATVLATGGLTRLYRRNSASANMGGDGYALALRAGAHADRHGIRAVLSDRASGAAAGRHGPDHVGSVPLQARRPAAQRPHGGVHLALRLRRGRQIRADPRSRDLRDLQGGRGRARLAARRRVSVLRALLARQRCARRSAR